MGARNRTKAGRRTSGGFISIPHVVMESDDYRNLPPNAIRLLNAMIHQYRGKNNGDLTAAFTIMKKWGFKSKQTLHNALTALQEANLIVQTRQGVFQNPGGRCSLFALTWHAIDECPEKYLDVRPTNTPYRKFSREK